MNSHIAVFRVMKPCALAGGYWYIGQIFCLCLQGVLFGEIKVDLIRYLLVKLIVVSLVNILPYFIQLDGSFPLSSKQNSQIPYSHIFSLRYILK